MPSTFYGLEIARSGLTVSQANLNITGHNISNINTDGYTRQMANVQSVPSYGYLNSAGLGQSNIGGGAVIQGVEQIRDKFLDGQLRNELSRYNQWSVKADILLGIEDIFDPSEESSIASSYERFLDSLQDFSAGSGAGSMPAREDLRQNAMAFIDSLNSAYNRLVERQKEADASIKSSVDRINIIADNISDLNEQIFRYELNGGNANDLMDKRNLLIDELASLTDISIQTESGKNNNNKVTIMIGGEKLVDATGNKSSAKKIVVEHSGDDYADGNGKKAVLKWESANGDEVKISSGSIKGYIELRDGDTESNFGIEIMIDKLNAFASKIVTVVNDIHKKGYSLPVGADKKSQTGIDFFDPKGTTAGSISLSEKIKSDVSYIAASTLPVVSGDITDPKTETSPGQNENLLKIISALNSQQTGLAASSVSFEEYIIQFTSLLGGACSDATAKTGNELTLLNNYINKRESLSGVSIDEEAQNLIRFQKSYAAAARVLTAMDEMLDVLINNTGIVGR